MRMIDGLQGLSLKRMWQAFRVHRCDKHRGLAARSGLRMMLARVLMALVLSFSVTATADAQEGKKPPAFESRAKYAILIDSRSGKVFYEKDADALMPPASMSKIMTMLVVFEKLKKGELSENDIFEVSVNAWRKGGAPSGSSTMFAKPGERIPLGTLMRAVIVVSANDAAIAIAEGISGTEEAFARLMTQRARALGLKRSTFANATGLPDPNHRMTARELAQLARYLIEVFPDYYKLYSIREFTWGKHKQYNRNPLLGKYPGADGVKTGYTSEAGYGLVASAERDGRRLIAVIAGLKSKRERAEEARRIMDWGFRQFRTVRLYQPGEVVTQARVWGGKEDWVDLVTHDEVKIRLSDAERRNADADVIYRGPLMAPVAAGREVAKLRIRVEGKTVATFPLYTARAIEADPDMWGRAADTIKTWIFGG